MNIGTIAYRAACALTISACFLASPAGAINNEVDNALNHYADFSNFHRAMAETGISGELDQDASYTVFAPSDAAFAKAFGDIQPCIDSDPCKAQLADIIRNHIARGNANIADAAAYKGGIFSINGHLIRLGRPNRDDYTADGKNISHAEGFSGGTAYTIDGVIATRYELLSLAILKDEAMPRTEISREKKTIPDPSCGAEGCPDASTEIITTYHIVPVPASR